MTSNRPYERGAARARHLRRLERRNIFGAAENPYRNANKRKQWELGFRQTYYSN